ncbi:GNAT family N-acetyltransferase [Herbiconiux sp. CPCC 203407]|uniref:GNAT family N-acetyltransferase n=1 Tax=Herbiconiux oxytropis TaxID=2970915 RepID=A0AA41XDY4_9MICO|nr:GNAT family N-acetyltransferase [Herbiconiux oxytropis]MCS5723495.1 GNAT family N-acetyltransferase [Herbiconiux oxytropis]MCS5726414.1 GNAT family N-acetyltransferase [Herbiconiux oxytropis]
MTGASGATLIAPWPGPPWGDDSAAFSGLLTAYHLQTEHEKGLGITTAADLPRRYRAEIDDPASTFARDVVLLAGDGASASPEGCVVLSGAAEVKRLWVEPSARGQGLATALVRAAVDSAVARGFTAVRLSVWEWRTSALALYERLGFAVVEPWDTRPGLICLRWDAPTR